MQRLSTVSLGAITAVLLGGAGCWAWLTQQNAMRPKALAEYAAAQDDERHRSEIFGYCVEQVAEWDGGEHEMLRQVFGPEAEAIVDRCRPVVAEPSPD